MAYGDRVGWRLRLHDGSEDLMPGAVVPEIPLHGLELRLVASEAHVPGERLRTVVVGVELIDGKAIVARRRQPDDERDAKQRDARDSGAADCQALRTSNSCARKRLNSIAEQSAVPCWRLTTHKCAIGAMRGDSQ